ncbi:MAG: sodium/proton-translocating pyrophosphatase [Acutalibacteraceae bacterium]
MFSIVRMIISNDAYGPIVDNARGLAEMGDLGERPSAPPTSWTAPVTRSRLSRRAFPSARRV